MTERLAWAIVGMSGALLVLGFALVAYYLRIRSRLKVREMLHSERLAAIGKGITNPMHDSSQAGLTNSVGTRLAQMPAIKMISLCGVILFSGGLGLTIGFRNSAYGTLSNLASLGYIPLAVGLGLLIYAFFLGLITRVAKNIRGLF